MARQSSGLLQGTLDLLVLRSLQAEPRHGYGVIRWLREASDEELDIEEGALYPALHRLEARGFVKATWGKSETNRRAKFYRLTASGRHRLRAEVEKWSLYVALVQRVVEAAS